MRKKKLKKVWICREKGPTLCPEEAIVLMRKYLLYSRRELRLNLLLGLFLSLPSY
jgi:hypothetical protein